jgi:hypothetical protein
MNTSEESIQDFSKHLLVTVFAIFAFTSESLLDTDCEASKIFFFMALTGCIISIPFGFDTIIQFVNYNLEFDDIERKPKSAPKRVIQKMKKSIQIQYVVTVLSLIFLSLSIVLHFFHSELYGIYEFIIASMTMPTNKPY